VLQRPPWLLIDDALGALDDETHERIIDLLSTDLAHTSVILIGRATQARDPLFSRVLHLVKVVPRGGAPRASEAPAAPSMAERT
jgi:vitamin B12/bleomycin/antimicrobial peptide transport system ATP-binding/permease protein